MNKLKPISALFEALTANMSTAEVKTAMVISDISARIEIERINRGMNQQQFAKFMGVSQGMVSKWESGDYNFTIGSISNIFDKLDLDFDFDIKPDNSDIAIIDFKNRNNNISLFLGNTPKGNEMNSLSIAG